MAKRIVKKVNNVGTKYSEKEDRIYNDLVELKNEDKVIRDSMNEWVDDRGNVINKYIYSEKWRYHLKIRSRIFNFLKGLVREEQEKLAKRLGVEILSSDRERDVIKKLLTFLIN